MRRLLPVCLLLLSFFSCKKDSSSEPMEESTKVYKDSVSFTVDAKKFSFLDPSGKGFGNRQINIKPSLTIKSDQKIAYQVGGLFWYGEKDSTLFDTSFRCYGDEPYSTIEFKFSKKFHNSQLTGTSFKRPRDKHEVVKVGIQSFAVDFENENTTDGVAIEAHLPGVPEMLVSYIPDFAIVGKSVLTRSLQDNSKFEVIKIEKLNDKIHLIEARFEINLYDKNGRLNRIKNGYLRVLTDMKVF